MNKKLKLLIKDIIIFLGYFFLLALITNIINIFINKPKENGMIIQIISSMFLSVIIYCIFMKDINKGFTDFKTINFKKYISLYFVSYISVIIINYFLFKIVGNTSNNELVSRALIISYPFLSFIKSCLIAPFCEEIIIRLNFKNIFNSKILFATITGMFFGSLHLLNASSSLELLYIIPYSILGITLSYIYIDSNNIFSSISIHFLNNFINFILVLIGGVLWKDLFVLFYWF